ncbi:MAG TPA: hypothetical protein PLJ27_11280 [Polyangiaceae bacterium]|jgi:hypothetical protein|nr:MAG: hypothetical protein BWY17_04527 [Deltaproteobacteria bacterium ADurb.Bin207]HNZ25180.1 hypothetical protein [Polyangiaceae bacterium]HOD25198.1 hypothetical protein [Polyangiaceae bacterium]HOE50628.1 hypothetical protein [Polyangiaceae bacterium]HOH03283.1 hypothetical protein [Polyangiaceae bacterium]
MNIARDRYGLFTEEMLIISTITSPAFAVSWVGQVEQDSDG